MLSTVAARRSFCYCVGRGQWGVGNLGQTRETRDFIWTPCTGTSELIVTICNHVIPLLASHVETLQHGMLAVHGTFSLSHTYSSLDTCIDSVHHCVYVPTGYPLREMDVPISVFPM